MPRAERLTALAVCAALAACQQPEPAAPPAAPAEPSAPVQGTLAVYSCESGRTVSVQYDGRQSAVVTYDDQTYQTRIVEAASGARYSGSGIQWWTAARGAVEGGTLGRLGSDGGVSAILERCSRQLPTAQGGPIRQSGPVACRTSELRAANAGGDAGMGNRVVTLSLRNTGTVPCTLTGYPEIAILDATGDAITSVRAERNPGNYFRQGTEPSAVILAPQGRAYFDLAWNIVPNEAEGQTTCPAGEAVRITPPGETARLDLAQEMSPCSGRVRVGPLRPTMEDQPPAPAIEPATLPTTET